MSAFIVNKTHIDAIVTVLYQEKCPNIQEEFSKYGGNLNLIGQILWDENFKSVNYRYSDDAKSPKYSHKVKSVSLIQAIKALDCLNYQSCEHPDYYASESHKVQTLLKNVLFRKMKYSDPEYEKAAWEVR